MFFELFSVQSICENAIVTQHSENVIPYCMEISSSCVTFAGMEDKHDIKIASTQNTMKGKDEDRSLLPPPPHLHTQSFTVVHGNSPLLAHQCENFAFPPPPPPSGRKRSGPRRKFFFVCFILSVINTVILSILIPS